MSDSYNSYIDYRHYITEQARDFYGHGGVLAALSAWLGGKGQSRFFAVIGPPGSGKTAIAARIAQFALGHAAPPAGAANPGWDFLSAIRFCPAADPRWTSDRRWFHPLVFAESLPPLVVIRKVSGGSLTPEGITARLALASLFHTWQARGLNPFDQCLALFSQPAPSPR